MGKGSKEFETFSVGELLIFKVTSAYPHVDVWPDPQCNYSLSYPVARISAPEVCIVLDKIRTSFRILASSGVVGWVDSWDLDRV